MKRIVVVLCGVLLSLLLLGCNTDANYQQGRELFLKGDYEQAAKLLQKSGDKGAGLLGVLYYWGKGVEQSWSSARSSFSCAAGTKDRAAEIEDPIVWFYMGNMYLIGESESAIQDLTKSRIAHYDPRLQLFRLGHWAHNEIDSPCLEVAWVEDLYNSGEEHVFIQLNGVCYNSDGSKSPSMIFSEDF